MEIGTRFEEFVRGKSADLYGFCKRENEIRKMACVFARAERARHLLVLIEIKAENATENGKTILRERYRRVLEIEKSARHLN